MSVNTSDSINFASQHVSTGQSQRFLTVGDVAKRFNVNVTTIYRLAQRGKLPAVKIGRQWRFSEVRLDEWLADRERIG